MKYSFETEEDIVDCLDCPFHDPEIDEENIYADHGWFCWINKRELHELLHGKPSWCPLIKE